MRVVKELEAVEITSARKGPRRIIIIERDDGFYAYAEEYHYLSEYAGEVIRQGWARLPSEGIFESPEVAEAEGRLAFRVRHGVAY